jgi:hypothetical protein
MKRLIVALLLALFISTPVSASYFIQGYILVGEWHEFQKFQKKQDHDCTAYAHYMGYISGVADAFDGIAFDVPENATLAQLAETVGKYIDEHPAELNATAQDLVIKALMKKFPKK